MRSDEHTAIYRRVVAAITGGDADALDAWLEVNLVDHPDPRMPVAWKVSREGSVHRRFSKLLNVGRSSAATDGTE